MTPKAILGVRSSSMLTAMPCASALAVLLVITWCSTGGRIPPVEAWKEFPEAFSSREGTSGPPLLVTSVADRDNDMHMDLLGVMPNRSGLHALCYDAEEGRYATCWQAPPLPVSEKVRSDRYSTKEPPSGPTLASVLSDSAAGYPSFNGSIVHTLIADMQRDGVLDCLVQLRNGTVLFIDGNKGSDPPRVLLQPTAALTRQGAAADLNKVGWSLGAYPPTAIPPYDGSIPQLAVISGFGDDGRPDLAFTDLETRSLILLRSVLSPSRSNDDLLFEQIVLHPGIPGETEVVPMSVAMEDLDGDCATEVIYAVKNLTAGTLEIYALFLADGDGGDPEADTAGLPQGQSVLRARKASVHLRRRELLLSLTPAGSYGIPTIVDVNSDGAPDILLPWCSEPPCDGYFDAVEVFLSDAGGPTASSCPGSECCKGHSYGFTRRSDRRHLSLSLGICGGTFLGATPASVRMPHTDAEPLLLRFGDYDRDGFTDLTVPSNIGPLVLRAVPEGLAQGDAYPDMRHAPFTCTALDPTKAADVTDGSAEVLRYRDGVPFFLDIRGSGMLDVIVTHHRSPSSARLNHSKPTTDVDDLADVPMAYLNVGHIREQYFFSASALNGVNGLGGVIQVGAVHRFQWQDINMRFRYASITQLSRTQGYALQAPHTVFGLGRTFSYIQGYAVGVTVAGDLKKKQWSAYLIPNSYVVAQPTPLQQPSRWAIRLYLTTSNYQELLLLVLCVVLIVIGIPIIVLKAREVQEDRRALKRR